MMELAKIAKLASLIKKKDNICIYDWKHHRDFLHETEKNKLVIYGFDD